MIKIIHQIWFNLGNGDNIPDKYKIFQSSWISYHPKWKYILWNEKMGDDFMKKYYNKYYDMYINVKYPIMKIDILRYCILHKYGGLYADIDYKCLNNFDSYIESKNDKNIFINNTPKSMYDYFKKSISNSLLISRNEKDIFWILVLDECKRRIETYNKTYYIWYVVSTTGPILLNDILVYVKNNNSALFNNIHILPYEQFNICNDCNKCYPSKTDKLYAVHDYASYWNDKYWLKIRKCITCLSYMDLLIIIIIFYILYQLFFDKFRS